MQVFAVLPTSAQYTSQSYFYNDAYYDFKVGDTFVLDSVLFLVLACRFLGDRSCFGFAAACKLLG